MRAEEFSTDCDGAFGLYTEAQHQGRYPDLADAQAHVLNCWECHENGNVDVLNITEWDDRPIPG